MFLHVYFKLAQLAMGYQLQANWLDNYSHCQHSFFVLIRSIAQGTFFGVNMTLLCLIWHWKLEIDISDLINAKH